MNEIVQLLDRDFPSEWKGTIDSNRPNSPDEIFRIGDKVYLSPRLMLEEGDEEFDPHMKHQRITGTKFSQTEICGWLGTQSQFEIGEVIEERTDQWVTVKWSNGRENCYPRATLHHVRTEIVRKEGFPLREGTVVEFSEVFTLFESDKISSDTDWGDWAESWLEELQDLGLNPGDEGIIVHLCPDEDYFSLETSNSEVLVLFPHINELVYIPIAFLNYYNEADDVREMSEKRQKLLELAEKNLSALSTSSENEVETSDKKVNQQEEKEEEQMSTTRRRTKKEETVITAVQRSKETEKIVIPESMTKLQASKELKRQWEDDQSENDLVCNLDEYHWKDVLYAIHKASIETFGWIEGKAKISFFGKQNPMEVEITIGFNEDGSPKTVRCYYGEFNVSAWGDATVRVGSEGVGVTCKKMFNESVNAWFNKIREYIKRESIFRGQAVRVTWTEGNMFSQPGIELDIFFMRPTQFDHIVLNEDARDIIENFIVPDMGLDSKRCYLFSGSYGTGKTETALRLGSIANLAGIPFFYCKDSRAFEELLVKAKLYQPCLIFMEDIDEIGSGEERTTAMNKLLNTLDGVETKNNSIQVILTTNHEKNINKALRRPGRIDLVMRFDNPNKDSIAQIMKSYFSEYKGGADLDYNTLAKYAPDAPGAVQAEICKRAVRLAKRDGEITKKKVMAAIHSMEHHISLMQESSNEGEPQAGEVMIHLKNAKIQRNESSDLVEASVLAEE